MNPTLIDVRATVARPVETVFLRAQGQPRNAVDRETWAWWLWPHLLSLDAPVVAVVWQRWWAHTLGLALPVSREMILGLGVWMIYLADRTADASGGRGHCAGAARHRFSGRFRAALSPLVCLLAATLAILVLQCLPRAEFRFGLGLLALAAGYFWLIHCWPGRGWSAVLPKEAVVGAIFAAGTAFFVACRAPHLPAAFGVSSSLFAMVCFLNCALITGWERYESDLRESSSLLNAFPWFSGRLRETCLLLAVVTLVFSVATTTWSAVPVAVSALLLAALDWCAPKVSDDPLRLLADALLLTPLVGLAM